MKIEVLYPEICCLFGDKANMRYFEMCLPQAEFIKTPVSEMPRFLTEDVDMVYFGSCSESNQERILSRLKDHKARIEALIEKGVIFLMTGNAFEIMGNYIEKPDGEKIEALGIVDFYAKRTIPKRNNSLFIGKFGETEIVGYTSRFSHSYDIKEEDAFINVTKGYGSFIDAKTEGIRKNNLYGTYLLGPFLIQNPLFTKQLMTKLGVENPQLAFEEEIMKAYDVRVKEFKTDIEFIG
jgi:CobQ-like glutamine amidotransferase family enzyme